MTRVRQQASPRQATFTTRPVRSGDVVWAGDQAVVNTCADAKPHLAQGTIIECDGEVAGVHRGHSLIFFHDDLGITSEIVGGIEDAVERMKWLVGEDA